MAKDPIIEPDIFIAVPPDLTPGEGITTEQAIVEISSLVQEMVAKLNGKISRGDGTNSGRTGMLDGQQKTVIFPSTPDTERVVTHRLGRVPVKVVVTMKDRAGDIYRSDETAWGEDTASLKCSVASMQADVEFY